MEILTIKIACVFGGYLEGKSEKICEVQSTYTLKALCDFILESFEFDNDHLHEFFISRQPIRSQRTVIEDELTTLQEIFPVEKNSYLFMHFDFGDDWVFKISHLRQKPKILEDISSYPRIIEHIGKNPEQYPMYEE